MLSVGGDVIRQQRSSENKLAVMRIAGKVGGVAIVLLLAQSCGSKLAAPAIASGDVAVYERGRPVITRHLTNAQVANVSTWLAVNDDGWKPYLVTPSASI